MCFAFFQCQKPRRVEALWTLRVICTTIQIDSQTAMINPYGEQCLNVWVVSEDSKDDSKMEGEHCDCVFFSALPLHGVAELALALTGRLSRPRSSEPFSKCCSAPSASGCRDSHGADRDTNKKPFPGALKVSKGARMLRQFHCRWTRPHTAAASQSSRIRRSSCKALPPPDLWQLWPLQGPFDKVCNTCQYLWHLNFALSCPSCDNCCWTAWLNLRAIDLSLIVVIIEMNILQTLSSDVQWFSHCCKVKETTAVNIDLL